MKIGVVHGRFQVFHNGHLEYALQAYDKCDFLVIGITNPDPDLTREDETNKKRALADNNPFTYWERLLMIKESMTQLGIPLEKFDIVPFPINFPERIRYYVPEGAVHYTRIYEPWNYKKIKLLEEQGYRLEILYEGTPESKVHTFKLPIGKIGHSELLHVEDGTLVRKRIADNNGWRKYVPVGTSNVIERMGLDKRLKK